MGRGSDLLFNPPLIKKAGLSSFLVQQSFAYARESSHFFFTDEALLFAYRDHLWRKDLFYKGGQLEKIAPGKVQFVSNLGSVALLQGNPVFTSRKKIAGERLFELGKKGLQGDIVRFFATQKNAESTFEYTTIYALDSRGDLYLQSLDESDTHWVDAYASIKEKITSSLSGPDGTLLFNSSSMILVRPDGVFAQIRDDLKSTSPLRHSKRFVLHNGNLLFLDQDGQIRFSSENIFPLSRQAGGVRDMAASGEYLALLREDDSLLVLQEGGFYRQEDLQESYSRVLIDEEQILLFGRDDPEENSSKRADLFQLK